MIQSRIGPPKPWGSGKKKRVTLIAGFRCSDGAIICADSQETAGPYRVKVDKLTPFTSGNFQVAIAGSGMDGDLIDGFVQRLEDGLKGSSMETLDEFRDFTRLELSDFINSEAATYPAVSRKMHFLVCARSIIGAAFEIWRTAGTRLIRVPRSVLVGWNEELYKNEIERSYPGKSVTLPISQTIFLALRIFALAKSTANYVGGQTTVVVARDNGLWVESPEWIEKLEERVSVFDNQFRNLMVACPDTSISAEGFLKQATEFQDTLIHLRAEYLAETAAIVLQNALQRIGNPDFPGDAYPRIPPGSVITRMGDGSTIVRTPTPEEIANLRMLRESVEREKMGPIAGPDQQIGRAHV